MMLIMILILQAHIILVCVTETGSLDHIQILYSTILEKNPLENVNAGTLW